MARTSITTQAVADSGLNLTTEAANVDGNAVPGDGNVIVYVNNADASSKTVTIQTGGTLEGKAVVDTDVTVPAGESRYIGRFGARLYNQPSDGLVYIDYSDVTSVTVAAIAV